MAFLCSGDPVDDDPRAANARQWETGCCVSAICPCCCAIYLRYEALQHDFTKYSCCQGYVCGSIMEKVPMQQDCPQLCLCCEVICCESCAISGTRIYVQDERRIQTDPCDNRIIRFNNCMQMLSCICNILAIFMSELEELARIIDLIADLVYCFVQACMQAQTHLELKQHPTAEDY